MTNGQGNAIFFWVGWEHCDERTGENRRIWMKWRKSDEFWGGNVVTNGQVKKRQIWMKWRKSD